MMNGVVYIIHWVPICDFEFKYVLLFLHGEMKGKQALPCHETDYEA